jgi:drug/metabolite transporter (DMT)-like permease
MGGPRSRPAVLARLAILAATLIWGTSFAIVQRALADLPVFHFLAYRFTVATLLLLPLVARRPGALRAPHLVRDGLLLGALLFCGFSLQTTGLLWTTPSRSAFLTGLAVVMVPPLAWLAAALRPPPEAARPAGRSAELGAGRESTPDTGCQVEAATGRQPESDGEIPQAPAHACQPHQARQAAAPPRSRWRRMRLGPAAGALCAAAGLYVLYQPGGPAAAGNPAGPATAGAWSFGRGDAMTLCGTLIFACHIVIIERAVRRRAASVVTLAAVQFAVVAAVAGATLLISPPRAAELTPYALFAIALSGAAGTVLAYLCQLYAQRHLAATEAAILLTLEPVVAALFSVAIGRESWSLSLVAGGALILAAMVLADLGSRNRAAPLAPGA